MTDYNISKYLKVRLDAKNGFKGARNKYIITLSRDFGCDGDDIAHKVIAKLNRKKSPVGKPSNWKMISKSILRKSAEELKVNPRKLERTVQGKDQGFINEILLSFGDQYPNDIKIKNTIRDVIEGAADEGHVLILGRAGEVITSERPNSLHIKVTAPYDWRVQNVSKKKNITKPKAGKLIYEGDRERDELKKFFLGDKNDEILYDAIFNRQLMNVEQVADIIVSMLEIKSKGKGI